MAVELSVAKNSLKATAEELGITPHILTRWRRERLTPTSTIIIIGPQVSQEQQEILRLKKQLRQAELERDILKKAVSIFSKNDRTDFYGLSKGWRIIFVIFFTPTYNSANSMNQLIANGI